MLTPPTDVTRIVFAPDDPLVVLALGRDMLVGSRDGGRVWRDIPLGAAAREPGLTLVDVTAAAAGHFTVLTDRGMVASPDGGETWIWAVGAPEMPGRDLRSVIHDLHTGHLLGTTGRRLVEAGALALIFITVTGVILFRRKGRFIRG